MSQLLAAQPQESAERLRSGLNLEAIPRHIAVIMDGNGRWAKQRGLERTAGHSCGVDAIHRTVDEAERLGVQYLSLYSFSTENMNRPPQEVACLFDLFANTLVTEVEGLHARNIRIITTGLIDWLPTELAAGFHRAEDYTAANTGLTLNLCVMYSGRAELLDAIRAIAAEAQAGRLRPEYIDEHVVRAHLYRPDVPDPDLLIRTSGEQRISNFLLWQIAYSELVFSEVLWPDFCEADFLAAVLEYQRRERRFGKL